MKFFLDNKVVIICVVCLILMLGSVIVWNDIINKQNEKKRNDNNEVIDVSKVNNVSSVEAKFGNDVKITQEYLLNYASNKASIWYMSSAAVKNIKIDGNECVLTLGDNNVTLVGTIDSSKCNVKVDDRINFVGTIDIKTGIMELSKISKDVINYKNVTEIEFIDLVENIKQVKSNYFVVIGFMVTDGEKYKLFDSKEDYSENNSAGNYFLLSWKEEFMYTGNQKVTVRCLLEDTYKLNMCELVQ